MRYIKISEHYKSEAVERLEKYRALQMQEGEKRLGTASPPNFPTVRGRALRDARKLKKRLVGAPGFEPGSLASMAGALAEQSSARGTALIRTC
jgi:hypothetical protein